MSADRTWLLYICPNCGSRGDNGSPCRSCLTINGERAYRNPASVVELSRLRKAEADNASLRLARDAAEHNRLKDNEYLLARAERAEADLQEARERICELKAAKA